MKSINLAGQWDFIADLNQTGLKEEFFKTGKWQDSIQLPGTVSEQKKVPENNEKNTGYLTDPYACTGFMWFKKTIQISDFSKADTYTLLLERTRVSHLWINGNFIGENNSLCGKHYYDITQAIKSAAENSIEIVLMIDNVSYPTKGGHMTSPDTQTNWIGITGELSILVENKIKLEKIRTYTSSKEKQLKLTAELTGTTQVQPVKLLLCEYQKEDVILTEEKSVQPGSNEILLNLPDTIKLWSAENPALYQLKIILNKNEYSIPVGIKDFTVSGTHFEINGRREFLRGKHDGMIFPETGYAPCNVDGWLKVMKTAKEYGINHYRFHTCCPPEAAFMAADILGIYLEPELPFWGTIQDIGEEGFNEAEQNYLISEGFKILDNFGNHPSFVMMSLGNELWGSGQRLNSILKGYHDYDCRHLYTSGSNNFQFWPQTMEYEDFFVGCRFDQKSLIRGSYAMCDAPQGFIQTEIPNANHDYDLCFANPVGNISEDEINEDKEIEIQYGTGVKKVKASSVSTNKHFLPGKPAISHEVGQYCMYPDYKELQRYTGVLKPYNYETFQNRLKNAGMETQAEDFFRDSSRLAVQCYKQEIEAIIRSNELSGFQLLDIQDFTGQGTAVVGILNAFMESKGIVSGEQWRSFCDKTVLLASFEKFVWAENESFEADILLSNYSDKSYKEEVIWAYLIDAETQEIVAEESFENKNPVTGNKLLGTLKFKFENISEYKKYHLIIYMNGDQEIMNSYIIHVYPKADEEIIQLMNKVKNEDSAEYKDIFVTKNSGVAKQQVAAGKKVLLIPDTITNDLPGLENQKELSVPGTYCTDFWCYPMFRSISESMKKTVPVGTLGLTIQKDSDIFADFPTDTYTTPKWYNIISNAECVNLSGTDIKPIVQVIDNFERNWKLGIVYESDKVTVCTAKLYELTDKAEAMCFAKSLLNSLK